MLSLLNVTAEKLLLTAQFGSYRHRNFLIRWPSGFVRKGRTDLVLFQQLYYVIIAAFLPIIGSGQISQIIRGDFPQVTPLSICYS